jgi:hypothetical protein
MNTTTQKHNQKVDLIAQYLIPLNFQLFRDCFYDAKGVEEYQSRITDWHEFVYDRICEKTT